MTLLVLSAMLSHVESGHILRALCGGEYRPFGRALGAGEQAWEEEVRRGGGGKWVQHFDPDTWNMALSQNLELVVI